MSNVSLALLGSGEFVPWCSDLERALLKGARFPEGPILVLPTASAPEGDATFEGWGKKGQDHYASLGLDATVVPIKTREDAFDPKHVALLDRAALLFASGGNPAYLAATLAGTPFWQRARQRVEHDGLAFAGCSAGAVALGPTSLDSTIEGLDAAMFKPGLGLLPRTLLGPHWDKLDRYMPGLRAFIVDSVPAGHTLLAIDEDTGVCGDGSSWTVGGRGVAQTFDGRTWQQFAAGERFDLPLLQLA